MIMGKAVTMSRPVLALAAVGALMAAGTLSACSKPKATANAPATITLTTAQVTMQPLAGGLTASGLLVSREESGVATELSGYRIAQVLVDEGAWVKQGQPLARLDDTLLKAQIDQQVANVALQAVGAERAQAEADRVKDLDNKGVLSQEQISERRLAARSALAQLAVAKAQLADLKTRQGRFVITAPVKGRVLERTARPGDTSSPATTLFRIARDGLVEMDAEVAEADLAHVVVGDNARVDLPSGEGVQGRVRFVSPRIDPQTKLGHARIALPSRPDLRPGGFAKAVFADLSRPAPVVPEAAVTYDADGASVMTVDAQNKVHKVTVKTGRRAKGFVEVVSGPAVGERVAMGGSAFVLEGDVVKTIAAGAARP